MLSFPLSNQYPRQSGKSAQCFGSHKLIAVFHTVFLCFFFCDSDVNVMPDVLVVSRIIEGKDAILRRGHVSHKSFKTT